MPLRKLPPSQHAVCVLSEPLSRGRHAAAHPTSVPDSIAAPWQSHTQPTHAAHVLQVYTPPYLLTGQPRPLIERAPEAVTWGQSFTVAFRGTAGIDRVVLNKLADNTHCISMDHRQVSRAKGQGFCIMFPHMSRMASKQQLVYAGVRAVLTQSCTLGGFGGCTHRAAACLGWFAARLTEGLSFGCQSPERRAGLVTGSQACLISSCRALMFHITLCGMPYLA